MKRAALLTLALVFFALPAHAELPASVLDSDYKNCAGDGKDPQRNAYCACVRDNMRDWGLDTYMEAATQAASLKPNELPTGRLAEISQQCINATLH